MNNHTAKHFVLQLGSLIALYLSIAFFLVLSFGLINLRFPDALNGVWAIESAASSVRLGFAMVLVFFPTYLVLTRMVNKNRRTSDDSHYLGLTKWLIYLSLLVAGITLLVDLAVVIMGLLEGELTTRFILKALAVAVVTGAAFFYYIKDAQGYWLTHERQSYIYAAVTAILVAATMIMSLTQIPNPSTVREMKADNEMVGILQDVQWRVEDYYRSNETLPANLEEVYGEFDVPPVTAELAEYRYEPTSETEYRLCTTFNYDVNELQQQYRPIPVSDSNVMRNNYNWNYKAGDWCFDRVVDEEYRQ